MTETTKTVFEKYEIRKTKRQKTAFIDYVKATAETEGYTCHTESGYLGARNIIVGNPEKARVVYTAHYDTCARLPFPNFITPKNIGVYLLYQILIAVVLLGAPTLLVAGLSFIGLSSPLLLYYIWLALLVAEMWLIMAGPANRHTANDNTSGVTALLDIMQALPEALRGEVAFIFFDLEEMGLLGSAGYASGHKAAMKDKLLLNFDCVSDGNTVMFAVRKAARAYAPLLEAAFPETDTRRVEVLTKGVFYPSDQANFPCGVGVAALKRTKGGVLYMDRIHTVKDTVYEEGNMAYLAEGAVRLVQLLCGEE